MWQDTRVDVAAADVAATAAAVVVEFSALCDAGPCCL